MGLGFIIISMIFALGVVSAIFVIGPAAAARARRWERDGARLDPASLAEIGRLREEVDCLSGEVHRLQEEQSFIVNLLGDAERKSLLEGPSTDA